MVIRYDNTDIVRSATEIEIHHRPTGLKMVSVTIIGV